MQPKGVTRRCNMALLQEVHLGDCGTQTAFKILNASPGLGLCCPPGWAAGGCGRYHWRKRKHLRSNPGPQCFAMSGSIEDKLMLSTNVAAPGLADSAHAKQSSTFHKRRTTTEERPKTDNTKFVKPKTVGHSPVPPAPKLKSRPNKERECNSLLSQCTRTDEVFRVVDTLGPTFTTVNAVTAFYTLARLSKGLRPSQKAALRSDPRMRRVARLAHSKILACGWRSLANLAWAEAHLQIGGPSFFEAIAEAAVQLPLERPPKPQELVALVSGFARCGTSAPAMFQRVAELVEPCVADYDGWQIAQLAWAFAKASPQSTDVGLWAALQGEALRRLDTLTPQSLSLLLGSWTEVGVADEDCFDRIAAAIAPRVHEYPPVDISFTARAFAKTGRDYSPLMAALAERSKAVVHDFAPENLAALIWSFGAARYYDEDLLRTLLAAHTPTVAALTPLEASNLLWGLAMLRYFDPAFLDAMAASVCVRVAEFEDTHLASVLFAYASFGAAGPPDFLPTLAREVLRRLRTGAEFKRASLVNIAWGFMVLGCYPPALFAAMRPALYRGPFLAHEAAKLHQLELALRLEAPTIAPPHPPGDVAALLEDLWQQGDAKYRAKLYWAKMNQGAQVVTSALQRDVHASLERLGVAAHEEYADGDHVLDIALPAQRIAVEVDGPHHFAANARRTPLGPTRLKHRLLRRRGWRLITVPHYEWEALSGDEARDEHMRQRLEPLVRAAQEDAAKEAPAPAGQPPAEQSGRPSSDAPANNHQERRPSQEAQAEILARSEKLKMLAASRGKTGKIDMLKRAAVRRALLSKGGTKDSDLDSNQATGD
ncbi:hypothetical protein KFL_003240180 [Klebsormidium nitens]|uniref:RAP domain-containing protein n=1 Tax=Klebsormidium nitens TaxID=105231 RepID=A0A1Y1IE50_KLENI|nr:hypothetical protein KFL_003240180 [Klebsormidium nitens]|eukprot:GAQ86997.1 hypothetical protein KFL_003240180 [Klebsormidium nitens]